MASLSNLALRVFSGLSLMLVGLGVALAEPLTHLQAAQILREELAGSPALPLARPTDENLLGLFPDIIPGGYNGTVDYPMSERVFTLEHAVVSIVRAIGWNTIAYDASHAELARPFVTAEGFPLDEPDPTPRSIPYIAVALDRSLLQRSELPDLHQPATEAEIRRLWQRAAQLSADPAQIQPPRIALGNDGTHFRSQASPGVLPFGFSDYAGLPEGQVPYIDLNGPGVRLVTRDSVLFGGRQDYFPLGPLDSLLSAGLGVPADSLSHQSQALYGRVDNYSSTVNAVGVWGSAHSHRRGARSWGGFMSAFAGEGADSDSQAVGLEVDVVNNTLPGVAPNASKVGVQVVGIGTQALTNAIEIIGAGPGQWHNGILFASASITPDGAVIGMSSPNAPVGRGIDFRNVEFRHGAMLLGNNQQVLMASRQGNDASIYTDRFGNGNLVLRAGVDGFRIASNDDSRNLLRVGDAELFVFDRPLMAQLDAIERSNRILTAAVALLATIVVLLGAATLRRWWSEVRKSIA